MQLNQLWRLPGTRQSHTAAKQPLQVSATSLLQRVHGCGWGSCRARRVVAGLCRRLLLMHQCQQKVLPWNARKVAWLPAGCPPCLQYITPLQHWRKGGAGASRVWINLAVKRSAAVRRTRCEARKVVDGPCKAAAPAQRLPSSCSRAGNAPGQCWCPQQCCGTQGAASGRGGPPPRTAPVWPCLPLHDSDLLRRPRLCQALLHDRRPGGHPWLCGELDAGLWQAKLERCPRRGGPDARDVHVLRRLLPHQLHPRPAPHGAGDGATARVSRRGTRRGGALQRYPATPSQ